MINATLKVVILRNLSTTNTHGWNPDRKGELNFHPLGHPGKNPTPSEIIFFMIIVNFIIYSGNLKIQIHTGYLKRNVS